MSISPSDLRRVAAALSAFGALSAESLALMGTRLTEQRVDQHDPVVGPNEPYLAVVCEGLVRESYVKPDQTQRTRSFVRESGLTGTLFDPYPCLVTIGAVKPTRLLVIRRSDFEAIGQTDAGLANVLRGLLAHAYRTTVKREHRFVTMSPLDHYRYLRASVPWLEREVALYEVASYLRITPEHRSRLRRAMFTRRRSDTVEDAAAPARGAHPA